GREGAPERRALDEGGAKIRQAGAPGVAVGPGQLEDREVRGPANQFALEGRVPGQRQNFAVLLLVRRVTRPGVTGPEERTLLGRDLSQRGGITEPDGGSPEQRV